eukprot:CCRYP_001989-RA/>CCRYP_001989-RA protein AED:0.27 eAED:0.27 QI:423/0.33/0.25/1/0/0/4/0/149
MPPLPQGAIDVNAAEMNEVACHLPQHSFVRIRVCPVSGLAKPFGQRRLGQDNAADDTSRVGFCNRLFRAILTRDKIVELDTRRNSLWPLASADLLDPAADACFLSAQDSSYLLKTSTEFCYTKECTSCLKTRGSAAAQSARRDYPDVSA